MKKPRRKVPPRKAPAPPKPPAPPVHQGKHPHQGKGRRGWAGGTPGKVPQHPVSHHKPVKAKTRKPRRLSPGWDVACCSAQALGTLLGWDWDQVLALYWRTAGDPDAGATILDTLIAAEAPAWRLAPPPLSQGARQAGTGLILGTELPGPHAIAVTPDGTWWSWGEPFNPAGWPELVIEEAWAVLL